MSPETKSYTKSKYRMALISWVLAVLLVGWGASPALADGVVTITGTSTLRVIGDAQANQIEVVVGGGGLEITAVNGTMLDAGNGLTKTFSAMPLPNRLIIQTRGGADTVNIGPDSSTAEMHTLYVHTGSGGDLVNLLSGLDVNTAGDFTVDLGSGNDTLEIFDATVLSNDDIYFIGGTGNDGLDMNVHRSGMMSAGNRLIIDTFEDLFFRHEHRCNHPHAH